MDWIWDVLLTAVCVLGLAGCFWWLLGRLLRPIPRGCVRVVLSGRGRGADLEQSVRSLMWLRGLGLLNCPILIADLGLNREGREIALRLAVRWPGVVLWPADRLEEYIAESD